VASDVSDNRVGLGTNTTAPTYLFRRHRLDSYQAPGLCVSKYPSRPIELDLLLEKLYPRELELGASTYLREPETISRNIFDVNYVVFGGCVRFEDADDRSPLRCPRSEG
jgi:hypothetical protein